MAVGNGTAISALENSGQFLIKVNVQLPYNTIIWYLGIYPRDIKTYVHSKARKRMFIEASFATAKNWKQPQRFLNRWMVKHTAQRWKRMNACINLMHCWISRELNWMKKANPKKLWTVRFYLCNILKVTTLWKWRTEWWLPVSRKMKAGGRWVWL